MFDDLPENFEFYIFMIKMANIGTSGDTPKSINRPKLCSYSIFFKTDLIYQNATKNGLGTYPFDFHIEF